MADKIHTEDIKVCKGVVKTIGLWTFLVFMCSAKYHAIHIFKIVVRGATVAQW